MMGPGKREGTRILGSQDLLKLDKDQRASAITEMIQNTRNPEEVGRRFLELLPSFSERLEGVLGEELLPQEVPGILALKAEVNKAKEVATEDNWKPSFIAVYIAVEEALIGVGGNESTTDIYSGGRRRSRRLRRSKRSKKTLSRRKTQHRKYF